MDRARVLQPAQRRALEERLHNFERNTGRVVVVHTTPSLEGLAINEYSSRVAERWRLRRSGLESGAILTFAPNERKVNIEVGPRLQGALADPEVYATVQDRILDGFRRRDVPGGIEAGVDTILVAVARTGRPALLEPAPVASTPLSGTFAQSALYDSAIVVLLVATLAGVACVAIGSERSNRARRRSERGRASDEYAYSAWEPSDPASPRGSDRTAPGTWQPVDAGDTEGWSYYDAGSDGERPDGPAADGSDRPGGDRDRSRSD